MGVSLYAYEWVNPYYDKTIDRVKMICVKEQLDTKPILVAMTAVEFRSIIEGISRKD